MAVRANIGTEQLRDNILKSQLQTIENQRVPLNSVETEFSQMPDLLCVYSYLRD